MRSEACDPSQEEPNIELEIASYINTHLQAQPEFFFIYKWMYTDSTEEESTACIYYIVHGAKIYYTYIM